MKGVSSRCSEPIYNHFWRRTWYFPFFSIRIRYEILSENAIQITLRNRFPFQFNTSTAVCRCSDSFRCLGRYWNAYNQFKELYIYNNIHYVLQVNLTLVTIFIIWPARPRAHNSIEKTLCKLTSVGSDELTRAIPRKAVRPCTQAALLQKNLTEKRKEFLKKNSVFWWIVSFLFKLEKKKKQEKLLW